MSFAKHKFGFLSALLTLLIIFDWVTGQDGNLGQNSPDFQINWPDVTTEEEKKIVEDSLTGERSDLKVLESTTSSRLEESVSLLSSESQLKLTLGVDFLAVASTKRTFPRGLPLLVLPDSPFGASTNTFSAHARQSFINASLSGPTIGDFQLGGNVLAFFQNDNLTSDDYGLLVYFAYGELKNESWRFAAGLQQDVFNPVSPTVLYLTKLYASGNTGSYRGQFRIERFFESTHGLNVTTQFALSDPLSFLVTDDLGRVTEDNGWPNVEARIQFDLGEKLMVRGAETTPIRIGASSLIGQIRTVSTILGPPSSLPPRSIIDVWGLGADIQIAIGERLGFVAEFFGGQGLGDYNGGILQSSNIATLDPVRSIGGFGELYYYFDPTVHCHAGYGIDDPRDSDLAPIQMLRNESFYATLIWDISKSLQLGLEIDYRKTSYTKFLPNAFLDADAVVFGSKLQWRF